MNGPGLYGQTIDSGAQNTETNQKGGNMADAAGPNQFAYTNPKTGETSYHDKNEGYLTRVTEGATLDEDTAKAVKAVRQEKGWKTYKDPND